MNTRAVEPTGPDLYVMVETASGRWTARVPGRALPVLGEGVQLACDPAQVQLLAAASERRV